MNIQNKVVYEYIEGYIRSVQPVLDEKLEFVRKDANSNKVPIIKPEVVSLLKTILAIKKPDSILEIGTAVGFSALVMSEYITENGYITTIERNESMYKKASQNIRNFNMQDKINIKFGDALDILPTIKEKYDVIFIDASKGHYDFFYEQSLRLLNSEGIIIADNVLYKGLVAKERLEIMRRNRTIHKRMRIFIESIMRNKNFESTLIPVGDGIIISKKLRRLDEND